MFSTHWPSWATKILLVAIVIALVEKFFHMIVIRFPASTYRAIKPNQTTACLVQFNKQVLARIGQIASDHVVPNNLYNAEIFDSNIRLIVDGLVEHIQLSTGRVKDKDNDIFISVYSYNDTEKVFTYEFHFHFKRDRVRSERIPILEEKFKHYECVKIMAKNLSTAYVLNRKDYAMGDETRFKTMKQYMGCKLESKDTIFGFLNIEFHNRRFFLSRDSMEQFMENHVFPFKLLLENQYLNRDLMDTIRGNMMVPMQPEFQGQSSPGSVV